MQQMDGGRCVNVSFAEEIGDCLHRKLYASGQQGASFMPENGGGIRDAEWKDEMLVDKSVTIEQI